MFLSPSMSVKQINYAYVEGNIWILIKFVSYNLLQDMLTHGSLFVRTQVWLCGSE